jgi:hypothetical protein
MKAHGFSSSSPAVEQPPDTLTDLTPTEFAAANITEHPKSPEATMSSTTKPPSQSTTSSSCSSTPSPITTPSPTTIWGRIVRLFKHEPGGQETALGKHGKAPLQHLVDQDISDHLRTRPVGDTKRTETKSANQRRPTPNSEPDLSYRRFKYSI